MDTSRLTEEQRAVLDRNKRQTAFKRAEVGDLQVQLETSEAKVRGLSLVDRRTMKYARSSLQWDHHRHLTSNIHMTCDTLVGSRPACRD